MKMERIVIQLSRPLKQKLDALKSEGYTASGYVRALLERELNAPKKKGV
jgi:mannitol/fructose-specific phosphotransferase system IIA component